MALEKIQLRHITSPPNPVDTIFHVWKGIAVQPGAAIQLSVICATWLSNTMLRHVSDLFTQALPLLRFIGEENSTSVSVWEHQRKQHISTLGLCKDNLTRKSFSTTKLESSTSISASDRELSVSAPDTSTTASTGVATPDQHWTAPGSTLDSARISTGERTDQNWTVPG